MLRRVAVIAIAIVAIAGGWWIAVRFRNGPATSQPAGSTATAGTAAAARKITATLFYVSEDGMSLVGVQREVGFGETVLEQARQIVDAQLAAAPQPLVSAIPQGVAVRTVYVTERGDERRGADDAQRRRARRTVYGVLDRQRVDDQPARRDARADPRGRQGGGYPCRARRSAAPVAEEHEVGQER
jgi:hypothetical protein